MKTAAVVNTVPSQEVTRLMLGRTGKIVLSSVREHKLLQATFLCNNVVFSHELQRDAGQGYPVSVAWLPSHFIPLGGSVCRSRATEWVHEFPPAQPPCSTHAHRATPPTDKF